MVDLTDKQRRSLLPTRAQGGAVAPSAKHLKALAKLTKGKRRAPDYVAAMRAGATLPLEPELEPVRREAIAILDDPSLERVGAAALEGLAAAERLLSQIARAETSLTDVIVPARGLADAVEVKRRALGFGTTADGSWTVRFSVVRAPAGRLERHVASWERLRHAVCAADDDAYAEARARALEGFDDAPLDERAKLAFAFPDEPWAEVILSEPHATAQVASGYGGTPSTVAQRGYLLSACRDPAIARRFLDEGGDWSVAQHALELALALPAADAVPLFAGAIEARLVKPKYGPLLKTPPRTLLAALVAIGDASASEVIARYVGHRILGAMADDYFRAHPERRAALDAGGAAADRLAERLDELDDARSGDAPVASEEAVPAWLRDRAWRKKRAKPPTVRGVSLPEGLDERVELPEDAADPSRGLPPLVDESLEGWRADAARGRAVAVDVYFRRRRVGHAVDVDRLRVPDDEGLACWNAGTGTVWQGAVGYLARHGVAALPGFTVKRRHARLDYEGHEDWSAALEAIVSPRMAPTWAYLHSRKPHRALALRWLTAHSEVAALGLIPDAVGASSKTARRDAEAALVTLHTRGHSDAIHAAATRYEGPVRDAIDALLARDPMVVDAKPKKRPEFLRVEALPPLTVDGARLPDGASDAAVELFSVADPGHPGFARLREACGESLDAFVEGLVEAWGAADGPGRHDWMARAAVAAPSDRATDRLASLARRWASSKQAAARRACDLLAEVGTDRALLTLGHVAATTRFAKLKGEAAAHLDGVARDRGLTRDELEDRTVPALGLDDDGRMRFGFDGLVAVLDETLSPSLRDAEGEPLRAFPRAKKGVDDAPRKAAKKRWDALKKDVARISDRHRRRLERAMARRRAWTVADARRFFFDHPLARHLARGLVWTTDEVAFRVAEDGTFADIDDEALTLSAGAVVRIAHPLELDVARWGERFSDYELLQPFEQLGRPVHAPTKRERGATQLTRVEDVETVAKKLLGALGARGWERGGAGFVKDAPYGVRFTLAHHPGFEMDMLDAPQTLGKVTLERDGARIAAGDVDPVAFSELCLDLDALRGTDQG